jgi:hypothetical protein
MALADLLISTFTNSFNIVGIIIGKQLGRNGPLCNFIGAVCLLGCASSLLTMGVLAINRYINICANKYYKKVFTVSKTCILCFLCWVGALFLDFPNLFGWGNHSFDLKSASCVWNRLARLSNTIFFSTSIVFIPSTVILIFYIRIFYYIYNHESKSTANTTQTTKQNKHNEKSLKIAISLFVPFIVLVFCW